MKVKIMTSETEEPRRRSTRMKVRPLEIPGPTRVISNTKKLNPDNLKHIHNYYLDKKVHRSPSTLETIFEEPGEGKPLMSTRKFLRKLTFDSSGQLKKTKLRKRHLKATRQKGINKRRKLNVDTLLETLSLLEEDSEEENVKKMVIELPMFNNTANSSENAENDETED